MDSTLQQIYSMTLEEIQNAKQHVMVGGGTPGPVLVKGKGVRIEDIHGKSYIDCTSQSWAMYLGFANDEVNQAITEHIQNFTHVHQGFHTLPRLYLANKLADIAPENMSRVSFTVGGGPAVESAMKIAMINRPTSKEFISLWDGYHGSTFTAASLSWIGTQTTGKYTGQMHFMPRLETTVRIPNPYCYRCVFNQQPETCDLACAEMLRHTLIRGVNGPAAGLILEPVQASGGQIPFPKRYLQRVREICDEFDVLLIFDEIQTYCRIGDWFASSYYGVTPDVIVLGKGLGAGLPIAAIIIHDKLEGFGPHAEELHTFANNSLSQVTAAKMIEIIARDRLLENTCAVGEYITNGLRQMQADFPEMGDIRAVGLHIGVEFVSDPVRKESAPQMSAAIREEGIKLGAIFGLGGARPNVLKVKPPLIINRQEADEVLDILNRAMTKVLRS
jgi:4-aminobutyrate aminotransferase-like enzyme